MYFFIWPYLLLVYASIFLALATATPDFMQFSPSLGAGGISVIQKWRTITGILGRETDVSVDTHASYMACHYDDLFQ